MKVMKAPILAAFLAVTLLGSGATCLAKDSLPGYVGIWVMTKTESAIVGTGITVGPGGSPQLTLKTANTPVEVAFVFLLSSKGDVYATVSQILVGGQTTQDVHYSWKGKFDGSDYPVQGDPDADTWSYTQVNEHELQQTAKKGGKVVRQATLSFHGKKCTISGGGTTTYYEREHVKGEMDVVP
ncbi:MAG: hypothetical protein P4K93_06105 [Terracidiphilus sp.]|nr:hypothetical protein [Terracidiphilus sp.]